MNIHAPYLPAEGRVANGGPVGDGQSITADSQTLMRQGAMTAAEYLRSAVDHIDAALGKGYAKAHPELIGTFMLAATVDLGAAAIARAAQGIAPALDGVAEAIHDVAEAIPTGQQPE